MMRAACRAGTSSWPLGSTPFYRPLLRCVPFDPVVIAAERGHDRRVMGVAVPQQRQPRIGAGAERGDIVLQIGQPFRVISFLAAEMVAPVAVDHVTRHFIGKGLEVGCPVRWRQVRSEEHTSELQSLMRISYAVFCLK